MNYCSAFLNFQFHTCVHVFVYSVFEVSQVALLEKNPPANEGDKKCGFDPWVRKIPWRRTQQPTPVFLPGFSLGMFCPQGCKESDLNEATQNAFTHVVCFFTYQILLFLYIIFPFPKFSAKRLLLSINKLHPSLALVCVQLIIVC